MKKLAIDLGNSNMKVATVDEKGNQVLKVVKSLATKDSISDNHVVSISGETVYFGVGDPLVENDKTKRKYLEHSLLLAADLAGVAGDVEIAIGLPLKTYKSNKKELYKAAVNEITDIEGTVNNKYIKLKVKQINVCAEGYSCFVACRDDIQEHTAVLHDFGYRTLDVVSLKKIDGIWRVDKNTTVQKGMLEIYKAMSNSLLDVDIDLTPEEVEYRLEYDPLIPTEEGTVDIREHVIAAKDIVEAMMKEVQLTIPDVFNRRNYVAGGGGKVAYQLIKTTNKQLIDADKALFGNAMGYLLQMK